jgi:excisionase family DNA binding protein
MSSALVKETKVVHRAIYTRKSTTEALLKLAEKTVYAMAQAGEIPAFKIRGRWRIKRTERDQRIDAQPRDGNRGQRWPSMRSARSHRCLSRHRTASRQNRH